MNVESRTLERSQLQAKVLPELQQIAGTLGVEGHQRLKKSDLIDAIIAKASSDGKGPSGNGEAPAGSADARPEGAGECSFAGAASPAKDNSHFALRTRLLHRTGEPIDEVFEAVLVA